MVHIPIWLLVAGILVLAVPAVYFVYDAFCKPEDVNPGEDDGSDDGDDYEGMIRIMRINSEDDDYANDYADYEDVPVVYFVYDAFCIHGGVD